jgi:hypothetical protein
MTPGAGPPPFTVTFAAGILDRLREWGLTAARLGLLTRYLAALREAEQQLRTRPREWGDPLYEFHNLSAMAYQRYTPLLVFRYAVHLTQPFVFVREVVLAPGSPLAG